VTGRRVTGGGAVTEREGTEVGFDTALPRLLGRGAAKLARELELRNVGDLLFHLPRRYDERGRLTDIGALKVDEQVTIQAQVRHAAIRPMRNRPGFVLEAVITDEAGDTLTLVFFAKRKGVQESRQRDLRPGRWGLFAGTVTEFRSAGRVVRQLAHPDYEMFDEPGATDAERYAGSLIAIYPATQKVKSWEIARAVRALLDVVTMPPDPVPEKIRTAQGLVEQASALREIHAPGSWESLRAARHRLTWDEAFAVQLRLVQRKRAAAAWPATPRPPRAGGVLDAFDAGLPYELTAGQRRVGERLAVELASPHPMHRLLQGEVGSGKTVCAVRAALQVVDAGGQAALLAPTEVLAAQHHRSVSELLGPLGRAGELGGDPDGTRVELVTGSLGAAARRRALAAVADGSAGIVVGTHALLYEQVEFRDLGLVVVDEQHRFGVEQRDALRAKAGRPPHVLVMTATPIPRTVAMTVYGDLEVSTLRELPAGRSPIATHVVPATEKPALFDRAWQRVREEVAAGHQVYVVCPRIGDIGDEESASPGADGRRPPLAVLEVAEALSSGPLSELRLGVLHGRLPADDKGAVMRSFVGGGLDVLVATTVVEVGVDVPNATMMVVLDADRFGVSQLHQLRGRVGRGSAPGLCLLVTEAVADSDARVRLDAVASTLDGFRLAELDLEQRREGDVLGAAQSGRRKHLQLLSLLRDAELITRAREEAIALLAEDPELSSHPGLAATVATLVDAERAEYLEKS
jgi:ATP-dependent DNA helicase RecG